MSQEKQFDKRYADDPLPTIEERLKLAAEIEQCIEAGHHKAYGTSTAQSTLTAGNAWWRTIAAALRDTSPSHVERITPAELEHLIEWHDACAKFSSQSDNFSGETHHEARAAALRKVDELWCDIGARSAPSTTPRSSETPRMDAVSVAMFAHFKTSAMTVQDIEDFLAEGRKLERELAVSFKRFDDLQAHYSNELTKLEGASAASAIGEPVAEVVEIKDTMDSYTQRPPKSRSIVPYKPIDQLQVGTKLYTHPPTTGRSEIVEECAKVADYMHENGLNTSADQALLDCAHGIRALKNRADGTTDHRMLGGSE